MKSTVLQGDVVSQRVQNAVPSSKKIVLSRIHELHEV
jgi:hypothetical protein